VSLPFGVVVESATFRSRPLFAFSEKGFSGNGRYLAVALGRFDLKWAVEPRFALRAVRTRNVVPGATVCFSERPAKKRAVVGPKLTADVGWPSWRGSPEAEVESRFESSGETCVAALFLDRTRALVQNWQARTLGWSQSVRYAGHAP
jgi:hypothetical protein